MISLQQKERWKITVQWSFIYIAVSTGHCINHSLTPDITNISWEETLSLRFESLPTWRAGALSAWLFLITRILSNVHWSVELLHRSRKDQLGPDTASSSIITSTTLHLEIHDLGIFPVPKSSANAMRISMCTEPEWTRGELQKNPSSSFFLLLDYLISRQSTRKTFFNFMLKSCYSFRWFNLLWTLPPTSVEGGLYPEESPENWNKSFSEIIQGSILPPTPNHTSLYSQAMVIHSHSWLHTMETSKKPGGTIWDIWDSLPRKQTKKPPKTTTADKTVSSLLHIERDFQNLQTPTCSFQGKSQFEKFTLFCFHFVFYWLIFFLYNIYNGRLWFLFSDSFFFCLCNWWIQVDTCKYHIQ